jgi:hypothetical protein
LLALLVSALVALYLLGPDLVSRWILSLQVPRRNVIQSRGEEVTRAILLATVPLAVAVLWAYATGALHRDGNFTDLQTVFSGLYSEHAFEANQAAFFASLHALAWVNLSILWRLYLVVIAIGFTFNLLIRNYNRVWNLYRNGPLERPVRFFLTSIVLPRISEWHVLLSGMRLPPGPFILVADILTKSSFLYQGRIQDKMLNPDGSLHTITLASPRRFLREEFQAAHALDPEAISSDFWKAIPGNLFVIMGSDIVNLNLKYIRQKGVSFRLSDEKTQEILGRLYDHLGPSA